MAEERWTVERLNSNNYTTWKFRLKHLLIAKDLYGYVDGSIKEPDSTAEQGVKDGYTKKFNQAMSTIVLAVSDELLYLITECTTPKLAWEKLQAHFERDTLANKLYLKKRYFRTVMKEGTLIEQHIKYMKELTDKLGAIKAPISEEDQVVTLLGSLPESYSTLVTALEARVDDLSLTSVQQALLNEEQRREKNLPTTTNDLDARRQTTPDVALTAGRYGRKLSLTCYECGQLGHIRRNCSRLTQKSIGHRTQEHKAKQAAVKDDDFAFMMNAGSCEQSDTAKPNRWLIDSGATRHMTPDRVKFKSYTMYSTPEKVALGDGHIVDAIGAGNVEVLVKTSRKVTNLCTIHDVLHVPDLKANLFSVRSAAERDTMVQFGHTRCWLKNKHGKVKAMGTLVDKLYYLDTEAPNHNASVAQTDLWHQRLSHAGMQTIQHAYRNNLVLGADLSNVHANICEPCIMGKMSRKPFKSVPVRSTRPLELVHSDVCGPMQNVSIGGSRYFVSFIDDYTRFVHVYFLREKSDVFDRFREFESLVTNQTGLRIGTLRSDGGGEYVNSDFEQYLVLQGIHHELTIRYSPEQNGVAERYNRTICESGRAMLNQSGLPKRFWAEAIATAVYVRNRLPTSSLAMKTTPHEMWYGRKPAISHLKVFGCVCYAHIPDQLRQKLDDKAESMVFVGYSTRSKGYRLYDPRTMKVVTRRDVQFHEKRFDLLDEQTTPKPAQSIDINVPPTPPTLDSSLDRVTHQLRRSERHHQPPQRYGIDEYASSIIHHSACLAGEIIEPSSYADAINNPQSSHWLDAARSEYQALMENETWSLVELPKNRKAIGCKWVFKAKYTASGEVERFKGRLVAKGYAQMPGIDYEETYAPVVKYSSLRTLLSYAIANEMVIHQMDVVTAFLNGNLDEELYMAQPEGFVKPGEENLVCRLNKSIYGLKQSPRCWNIVLDTFLKSLNFTQSNADQCVYIRNNNEQKTIIAVYVDDLVIIANLESDVKKVKTALANRFQMKDLGELHYCLGINVLHQGSTLKLCQKSYVEQILRKYGMEHAKPVATPAATDVRLQRDDGSKPVDPVSYQSIVGSLLYASIATRPDIAHSVGVLSKFNSCPTETHLTAAKRVLRYLKNTADYGMTYHKSKGEIEGFSDASWGDDYDNRRSTSGYVFMNNGGSISWMSKQQSTVALSTAESEYIALFNATKEAVWLRHLHRDVTQTTSAPTIIQVDNQSAISIANFAKNNKRTKHMDIKFHYTREAIADKSIATTYCPTANMLADIFTKPLAKDRFIYLRAQLGISV